MQYFDAVTVYPYMNSATDLPVSLPAAMSGQDDRITEIIAREGRRLRSFIRRRVADPGEVEDILQDVFYELVAATRLLQPIEQIGAWLFRVARNRIIDRFRKIEAGAVPSETAATVEPDEELGLEQLLPSAEAGPEALFVRRVLLEELESALEELPAVQREVFLAHELEGKSFREMARQSGLSINTLLARKRYAVLHLRKRLQDIYEQIQEGNG